MNKKIIYSGSIAAVLALLGAGYLLLGNRTGYAEAPKSESPVSVEAVAVEQQQIDSVITAAGALTSRNTSVLSSKVMGRVIHLGMQEGDLVSEGKLLIRIESGELTAQALQAQAAYDNARLQYDRIKGLYDEKASTKMEMDQATLGLRTAEAGLKAAKAMESYTVITAPITGRIVEKRINLGETAIPGQPLIRIEDNRNLRLEVTVKEQDILHIKPGKPVTVLIDAMPGKELSGAVSQVVPASDVRTHSFIVKVDVPANTGLITGMYGKAVFSVGRHDALVVPRSAIRELSGVSGVYIVTAEGSARFQMVQEGQGHGAFVEITTGLKEGDRVITDDNIGRIDGKKVVAARR